MSAGEIGQWNSTYYPNATWSPDGSALYYLAGGFILKTIGRVDAATGAVTTVYTCASSDQIHCLMVTP